MHSRECACHSLGVVPSLACARGRCKNLNCRTKIFAGTKWHAGAAVREVCSPVDTKSHAYRMRNLMKCARFNAFLTFCCVLALISVPAFAQEGGQAESASAKVQELYSRARAAQAAGNLPEAAAR